MMELNITLFVQMGNFFIAYFILRHYVLLPALRILDSIEKKQNKLQEEVKLQEQAYQEQVRLQRIQLKGSKSKVGALVPNVDFLQKAVCHVQEISAQEIKSTLTEQEVKKIKEVVVQSVRR